jgi:hypothetical protein
MLESKLAESQEWLRDIRVADCSGEAEARRIAVPGRDCSQLAGGVQRIEHLPFECANID